MIFNYTIKHYKVQDNKNYNMSCVKNYNILYSQKKSGPGLKNYNTPWNMITPSTLKNKKYPWLQILYEKIYGRIEASSGQKL
jgi:hypothetical protein